MFEMNIEITDKTLINSISQVVTFLDKLTNCTPKGNGCNINNFFFSSEDLEKAWEVLSFMDNVLDM